MYEIYRLQKQSKGIGTECDMQDKIEMLSFFLISKSILIESIRGTLTRIQRAKKKEQTKTMYLSPTNTTKIQQTQKDKPM